MKSSMVLLSLMSILAACGQAAQDYISGHADIGFGYEDGAIHPHYHVHDGAVIGGVVVSEGEYEPGDLITVVPFTSTINRPAGSQWDFIGAGQGEILWNLPEVHQAGVPFLGFGAGEIEDGIFQNNHLTVSLQNVNGPGEFSVWQTDSFGEPIVKLSTESANNSFILPTGSHGHFNFGFMSTGIYEITLSASGVLADGTPVESETEVFTFRVVPEPAMVTLLISGIVLVRRNCRPKTFL